jgi:methionyl-tRNA formyltransferase
MLNPKILFLSSSNFGAQVLQNLDGVNAEIILVTASDKSKGRGLNLEANAAKKMAIQLSHFERSEKAYKKIQIIEVANRQDVVEVLNKIDYGLALIAGFSFIIPAEVLNAPKNNLRHLVLHPSLLPDLRGASPIQTALLKGYQQTGICLFKIEAAVDSGEIIVCKKLAIDSGDNYQTLEKKMALAGAKIFQENYLAYLKGEVESKPQKGKVSFTKQIEKTDGLFDFKKDSVREIYNKFRAYYVWPGIYFEWNNKKIKITDLMSENDKLLIKKVLPEGKKEMDFKSFINGYHFPLDFGDKITYPD